jgi:uncharacterized protein
MSSDAAMMGRPAARARRGSRAAIFLLWLRRVHLYVGLWGALLGLMFGATGIVMNHRAVMKLPLEKTVAATMQWPVADRRFASPQELATVLQAELDFEPHQVVQVKRHPAQPVAWGHANLVQPERWTVMLQSPKRGVTAEYFAGNAYVKLDRLDATAIGFLTRMHQSIGASVGWVLLADSIAGAFMLLCITGLLLWTRLNTMRLAACATSLGAIAIAALVL